MNADETLLAGTYIEGEGGGYYGTQRPAPTGNQTQNLEQPRNKGQMMEERLAAHLPMALFTADVKTGEVKVIHRSTDWLNHLEFSPTDPTLLMFCHEGPWHKVDRIWTIRSDGSGITKIHTRTMAMEIFGHEFWSVDGKTIWYDLQSAAHGEVFSGWPATTLRPPSASGTIWNAMSGPSISTCRAMASFLWRWGRRGAGSAHAPDGKWIYLFHTDLVPNRGGIAEKDFVTPGVFHAEKLGQHGGAQISTRAECQFYARRKVGSLPLQYAGPHIRLRRGDCES